MIVIANGELRAMGTLEAVLGGDDGPVTEVTAEDPDALAAALEAAGATVHRDGDKLVVPGWRPARSARSPPRRSSRCSASRRGRARSSRRSSR